MTDDNKIWGSEQPFIVPEGYFEAFDERIIERINPSKAKGKLPLRRVSMFVPWVGMAAAFLILALVYRQLPEKLFPERFNPEAAQQATFPEISPGDFFDEYELLEFITGKEDVSLDLFPDSVLFKGINEEDLMMLTLFH
jgi:hypothetical protein